MKTNNPSNANNHGAYSKAEADGQKVCVQTQIIDINALAAAGSAEISCSFALKKPVSEDDICITVLVLQGTAYWASLAASIKLASFSIDSDNNFTFGVSVYNNASAKAAAAKARVCIVY
jgi:hypothetical protein